MKLFLPLAVFVGSLLIFTAVCTAIWACTVDGVMYQCVDEIGPDYLKPGDWVHGHPVTVPKIPATFTMSNADMLKVGWSVPRLWHLWFSFFGGSLVASVLLAVACQHLPDDSNG